MVGEHRRRKAKPCGAFVVGDSPSYDDADLDRLARRETAARDPERRGERLAVDLLRRGVCWTRVRRDDVGERRAIDFVDLDPHRRRQIRGDAIDEALEVVSLQRLVSRIRFPVQSDGEVAVGVDRDLDQRHHDRNANG